MQEFNSDPALYTVARESSLMDFFSEAEGTEQESASGMGNLQVHVKSYSVIYIMFIIENYRYSSMRSFQVLRSGPRRGDLTPSLRPQVSGH